MKATIELTEDQIETVLEALIDKQDFHADWEEDSERVIWKEVTDTMAAIREQIA